MYRFTVPVLERTLRVSDPRARWRRIPEAGDAGLEYAARFAGFLAAGRILVVPAAGHASRQSQRQQHKASRKQMGLHLETGPFAFVLAPLMAARRDVDRS